MPARFGIEPSILVRLATGDPEDSFEHCVRKLTDFNISPSRYIHTGAGEEYRPIAEIVEELNALDEETKETDRSLRAVLEKICL